MNLTAQIEEYKGKIEALAAKAGLAESLQEKLSALEIEKTKIAGALANKKSLIEKLVATAKEAKTTIAALESKVSAMETDKKDSDAKALEIVGQLGLNIIPVISVTETDKPSANSIRAKYMELTDSVEKAKFFAEHRNTILNGTI